MKIRGKLGVAFRWWGNDGGAQEAHTALGRRRRMLLFVHTRTRDEGGRKREKKKKEEEVQTFMDMTKHEY